MLFDDNDALHVYTVVDGQLYAGVATASSGWTDWTLYCLHEGPFCGVDGRKHDRYRWEHEGVLSIPLERPRENGTAFALQEYSIVGPNDPSAPSLSVSDESSSSVELSWTEARGAESYTLHRRPPDGDFEVVADEIAENSFYTQYTDAGVSSGSDYEYRLTAVNSVGKTDSTIVRVTTGGSSNATMD
ncbi:fibronectin type III domain-containing protein [Haloferax volcanii]|uniref:fibronectin type III domain-containing protein n=1 Tax=Haloferax volcanii TaxID=2246 RepID=UPI00349FB985